MEITLRKWKAEDAKELAEILNNPNILKNLGDGVPYPYTEADALDYINKMLNEDENSVFVYAVCSDGKAVGNVGAFRQSNINFRTAKLGYYLGESYWGKNIMTEAVRQLCTNLFQKTDLLRIYAELFSYNTGSRRVLEKSGFEYEGTMKNNAFRDGKALDMMLYAITREKWYKDNNIGGEEHEIS